jgi:transposase
MWAPYYQAVRGKLSHAKMVVDRFHVMQCDPEIKKVLKGSRWIIVRNRLELSKRQAGQLNQILDLCPKFGA